MRRLSLPPENLKDSYEVIVIGSGYGGGIAASRLSRAGRRLCVLERGRELQPGDYPDNALALLDHVQTDLPHLHLGSNTALFDIRYNPDINIIVGCGLGGTSLINAGIAVRPEPRVFQDECWPVEIRGDASMDRYFGYAEAMLRPAPYPETFPRLAKLAALERSARALDAEPGRVPILVNFQQLDGDRNHVGVLQRPCVGCGDCVTGCNYHAKNTVLMNYLPDAANHGAEIYAEISARHVERDGGRWRVHCFDLRRERAVTLNADLVILAAGTLGSTEILLRSSALGLPLSGTLGGHFSGDGDMVGFAYNADCAIRGVGFGALEPGDLEPVGPCSTGMIDLRASPDLKDGLFVVEGTVPGAIAPFLPELLAAAAKLTGTDTQAGLRDRIKKVAHELDSKLFGARVGAIENTLFYLVVSQDDASGQMALENDRIRVRWPGVGDQEPFKKASQLIEKAARALGGTYVPNPVWNEFTNHNVVTGHPLGGCVMADGAARGVVNHKGQVFDDASPCSVHGGLYVMDGAVIPRAIGVNPLLTISALAERSCQHLAQDHGWNIPREMPQGIPGNR